MKIHSLFLFLLPLVVNLTRATLSKQRCKDIEERGYQFFDSSTGSFSVKRLNTDVGGEKLIGSFIRIHPLSAPMDLKTCPHPGQTVKLVEENRYEFNKILFDDSVAVSYTHLTLPTSDLV